ncbi:small nuclear ribonucleoprotein (snRNP)-like protein [Cytobacillus purgationiresistens]|uniref:Small nuclear ribonucleoprotein (SnRNP)-like protein n=1 Tax=Cytobacillus purgationiresistens TaxID=863449 RepID=A0ABU0AS05_9BACI|nr:small nuclear ribonucleoprotein (snRNP)-like protein [Cytobacillus purgationiresistens]
MIGDLINKEVIINFTNKEYCLGTLKQFDETNKILTLETGNRHIFVNLNFIKLIEESR